MTVRIADDLLDQEADSATDATKLDIERPLRDSDEFEPLMTPISSGTRRSGSSGSRTGKSTPAADRATSKPSATPSSDSTKHWRQPRTAREFAAQANAVATMVLNGEINLDAARTYSSVARTVAQALSSEVSRSRFLQTEPSLDLPQDVFDETEKDQGPDQR